MHASMEKEAGFTLLEMLIIVVVIMVLAASVMPLAQVSRKRVHEFELRQHLKTVRAAIDAFKDDWNREGDILVGPLCIKNALACKEVVAVTGYPKSLNVLLGVTLTGNEAPFKTQKRRYLRQIPVDPTTGNADWKVRCYVDPPDASRWCGDDVYDISSSSDDTGLDGTRYRDW